MSEVTKGYYAGKLKQQEEIVHFKVHFLLTLQKLHAVLHLKNLGYLSVHFPCACNRNSFLCACGLKTFERLQKCNSNCFMIFILL